jgi:hypothetical protein
VLIDADHYLWFCLRRHRLSPVAAISFFNEAHPPQHSATRALHSPIVLLGVLALAVRRRGLLPVAAGMAMHVAMDAQHEARMHRARAAALERDDFSCLACGTRAPHIDTHLLHQPWLLPSYSTQNLVSLCVSCHELAHARAKEPDLWT